MVRTQVTLTAAQLERLRHQAQTDGVSIAEEVRRAVDQHLANGSRDDQIRAALAVLGSGHSGRSDISERHDEMLDDAFAHP
jgi:hypothetical protein